MKALVYNGPWNMTLEELPIPEPKPGEVLLRMEAVGICGSDVHGFTGESGRRAPGMVMGHEAVGRVVATAPDVEEPGEGTRVAVYNVVADVAPTREEGDPSFLNKKVIGVNLGKCGAMAEFMALPAANSMPLPDGVPPEVGLLAEPISVVTHGLHRLRDKHIRAQRLAIIGSGTIGLSALLVARAYGPREIAILDTIPEKAQRARALGGKPIIVEPHDTPTALTERVSDLLGSKPDLVMDAVGTKGSFAQCISLVEERGAVLLIGNLAKEVSLPLQTLVSHEITLIGTYGFDRKAFEEGLATVPKIQRELATFIEARCSLQETPKLMTRLGKGEQQPLKAVIQF